AFRRPNGKIRHARFTLFCRRIGEGATPRHDVGGNPRARPPLIPLQKEFTMRKLLFPAAALAVVLSAPVAFAADNGPNDPPKHQRASNGGGNQRDNAPAKPDKSLTGPDMQGPSMSGNGPGNNRDNDMRGNGNNDRNNNADNDRNR